MSYWRRGREYVDKEEYEDERQQYKLDAIKEEMERRREEENDEGGDKE